MKILVAALVLLAFDLQAAEALYTVPVPADREDLIEAAQMMATHVKFEAKKDDIILKYKLPRALTGGESRNLKFKAPSRIASGTFEMDAPEGSALCREGDDGTFDCEVTYFEGRLKLARQDLDSYLMRTTKDQAQLPARQEVGQLFLDEARGVISGLVLERE